MKALAKFIAEENSWRSVFGRTEIKMPTSPGQCEPLFEMLECKLSPENLHCDGEISHAQAMRKKKVLDAAWKELEKIRGSEREAWI
jgi:hypothetical protein